MCADVSGVAVAYWNRRRQPEWLPRSIGGRSIVNRAVQPDYTKPLPQRQDAVRFTRGTPAHPSVFALSASAEYLLGFDMREIEAHVAGLSDAFIGRLQDYDIAFTTPVASALRFSRIQRHGRRGPRGERASANLALKRPMRTKSP
jgi:selenocysteine lyase/cysteine desulfurase